MQSRLRLASSVPSTRRPNASFGPGSVSHDTGTCWAGSRGTGSRNEDRQPRTLVRLVCMALPIPPLTMHDVAIGGCAQRPRAKLPGGNVPLPILHFKPKRRSRSLSSFRSRPELVVGMPVVRATLPFRAEIPMARFHDQESPSFLPMYALLHTNSVQGCQAKVRPAVGALMYWTSITHTPSRRHLCRVQTRRIPLRGLGHAHSSVRSRCLPRNRSRRRQSVGTRPRTTDGNCHTRLLHRLPLWVLWSPWASVLMPVWAFYVWESEEP